MPANPGLALRYVKTPVIKRNSWLIPLLFSVHDAHDLISTAKIKLFLLLHVVCGTLCLLILSQSFSGISKGSVLSTERLQLYRNY